VKDLVISLNGTVVNSAVNNGEVEHYLHWFNKWNMIGS
jgi:hypothetical protein